MTTKALLALASSLFCGMGAAAGAPETDDQKILYAVGLALARSLQNYDLSAAELATVQDGIAAGVLGREPAVALETYGPQIEGFLAGRRARAADKEKEAGAAFRDRMAAEEGAVRLDSGLVYLEQAAGDGAAPAASDTVKIHYRGTLREGSVFDSSMVEGGEPAVFSLSGVVPCFSEGIQRMRVGGKSKLVCPAELAYGDRGVPPAIPPGATLVFDVELLEVTSGDGSAAPGP